SARVAAGSPRAARRSVISSSSFAAIVRATPCIVRLLLGEPRKRFHPAADLSDLKPMTLESRLVAQSSACSRPPSGHSRRRRPYRGHLHAGRELLPAPIALGRCSRLPGRADGVLDSAPPRR